MMNRREAINRVALLIGGTVIGGHLFLEGCTRPATKTVEGLFEENQIDFLGNISDVILPETATPGAKEAGVGAFIPVMVRDCYTEEDQKIFVDGLDKLEGAAKKKFSKGFQELSFEQRTELIKEIDKEANDYQAGKKHEEPTHYFKMIKELTLLGFFTSELGVTKALRYNPVPGRFEGDIPYKKGDRAWA
ncbi:MAG TPA: gluconate 2-dehydrogenase subunit 3 family protein [Sphingobacteriaceae bacterium]|nr:gluconate 2-dehydrogenase subunit 3 family protein [Sphingobacteriaceae bacterium]